MDLDWIGNICKNSVAKKYSDYYNNMFTEGTVFEASR